MRLPNWSRIVAAPVVVSVALAAAGCGGGGAAPAVPREIRTPTPVVAPAPAPAPAPSPVPSPTPAPAPAPSFAPTAEQRAILVNALDTLEFSGMKTLSQHGREYLQAGRMFVADLEKPTGNPYGMADLDAAYVIGKDEIWVNRSSVRYMPPRHVGLTLLNEIVHAVTPGNDTEAEHALHHVLGDQYEAEWARILGRPFSTPGPGDESYAPWFSKAYWWKAPAAG